ncbi:F-box domain protein [Penicillium malachiteum]|uniref:F-box domain protein n=1 Tax=Penicillium malachiteum TaxID=1324776 RepID=UPI00254839B7|nr:F-box domain protein [Penicillium malachiteum]KAJ5735589.1 F-box domain protein [Penicillium malachiteum]
MVSTMPREFRSKTEYQFDEEQADAIVRATAYHRRDFCFSAIWYPFREHVNIISSIATPFRRTPSVGIGTLDRLPLELLFDTLCRLDIHSLFRFHQINLRSRQTVDSLSQYRRIVSLD